MIITTTPDALEFTGGVVCIGNFDGVHLGHRMLLGRMQSLSRDLAKPSLVITFDPPSKVVFSERPFLTSKSEKLRLLGEFTPDAVAVIPFDLAYAQTDKQVFLDQLRRLSPHTIIVGEDFRFGHKRRGELNDLSHVAQKLEVFGIKPLGDTPISSTHIRALLAAGDVAQARRFLGTSYFATGRVVAGARRGRSIDFPTANVTTSERKALPLGVFAVTVDTPTGRFGGMANVGPRPSFPEAPPSLEVHLFDFDGDLYNRDITVAFEEYIRGQKTFAGLTELKAQLQNDMAQAKAQLEDVL